ncbi:MAG: arylsulfotransferase family protein [Candidatus Dormibacteraceae bacterium]
MEPEDAAATATPEAGASTPGCTRRDFLRTSGGLALGSLLVMATGCGGSSASKPPARPTKLRRFHSRPDLEMPAIEVTSPARDVAPGYAFVTVGTPDVASGPLIVDNLGDPVWFRPVPEKSVADFRVQQYGGRPVLTWWEGAIANGHGRGEVVVTGTDYQVVRHVTAHGYDTDLHESLITPAGTALLTIYHEVTADLSALGGPKAGRALEGVIQEIDIASGLPVFEWHSLPQVALEESYAPGASNEKLPFDYFHVNSVDVDTDGNLLVSARNTWAVYKIDHQTGAVIWRLGGRKSDFTMRRGTVFAWQHDARRRPDGSITLFDNADSPQKKTKEEPRSRGITLEVNEATHVASLVRQYVNGSILATSQGSMQLLPDAHVFVGWGSEPNFTEFDQGGTIAFDAEFSSANQSYRAFRLPWSGRPPEAPSVAAEAGLSRAVLYASWNGATEVATWQVLAGPDPQHLSRAGAAPRHGFETAIAIRPKPAYVAAQALDAAGAVLATSRAIGV